MSTYLYADGVARLGRVYSGLGSTLGYRLIDATGNLVQPWTNAGVTEIDVPGAYEVILGGVRGMPVPSGFTGKVVWGTFDGVAAYNDLAVEWLWPGKYEDLDAKISSRMPGGIEPGAAFVDSDYPTADNLRFVTASGAGIGGATVQVYRKADYLAGLRNRTTLVGTALTGPDGRWGAIAMGADDYAAVFSAVGFKTALKYFTVT